MAGPAGKKGMLNARFGTAGKPVSVPAKAVIAARAGKGRVYEDGSYTAKPPTTGPPAPAGGPRKAGPSPAPQALANANPNARFKRGGFGTRPTTPTPKPKTLPRPPVKRP